MQRWTWIMAAFLGTACVSTTDADPVDTDTTVPDDSDTTPDDTDTTADTDVDPDDVDADGWTEAEGDCAPTDAAIHPGAADRVGDGVDENCDGLDGVDADADLSASTRSGGSDCNDADAAIHGLDVDGDTVSLCDGDCDDNDDAVGDLGSSPASCPRADAIEALPGVSTAGELVFRGTCVACHDLDGTTERVGPGLASLVSGASRTELVAVVLGGADTMVGLPNLSDQAIADVVAWMQQAW